MNKSSAKNIRQFMLVIMTAFVFAGCATTNPYSGEKETTKSTTGAIFGALGGALLGAAISSKNDRKQAMLKGAGIGALTGAGVGHYMDKQEDKLRQQLANTGVSVTRDGDNIILNMPSNITFDLDKSNLKPQFLETLDSVVLVLNEYPSTLINVVGHTDSSGSEAYNQKLSERRALAVAEYLVSKEVAHQRLASMGYGEGFPIASNDTKEGRAQNRRVELTLEPILEK